MVIPAITFMSFDFTQLFFFIWIYSQQLGGNVKFRARSHRNRKCSRRERSNRCRDRGMRSDWLSHTPKSQSSISTSHSRCVFTTNLSLLNGTTFATIGTYIVPVSNKYKTCTNIYKCKYLINQEIVKVREEERERLRKELRRSRERLHALDADAQQQHREQTNVPTAAIHTQTETAGKFRKSEINKIVCH